MLLPLAAPGLAAFAVVSLTSHWNEFLWPLIAASSPRNQVLTVGLASFASGAEAGGQWGVVAAGTLMVAGPLLVLFAVFQRRITASFAFSGIKVGAFFMQYHPPRCACCNSPLRPRSSVHQPTGLRCRYRDWTCSSPSPVQGKLANEMQRLVREFNAAHPDIVVTPVYTGSYDDTNLKTRSAIQAGRPPGAVIMSANFVREYVINDEIIPLDPLLGDQPGRVSWTSFWPALKTERHRERPRLRRPVPQLDAAALLQRGRVQRCRTGPGSTSRKPGSSGSMPPRN